MTTEPDLSYANSNHVRNDVSAELCDILSEQRSIDGLIAALQAFREKHGVVYFDVQVDDLWLIQPRKAV